MRRHRTEDVDGDGAEAGEAGDGTARDEQPPACRPRRAPAGGAAEDEAEEMADDAAAAAARPRGARAPRPPKKPKTDHTTKVLIAQDYIDVHGSSAPILWERLSVDICGPLWGWR